MIYEVFFRINGTTEPLKLHRATSHPSAYLGDCCTLEGLPAVRPSSATWAALSPVIRQQDIRGQAWGFREAEVQAQRRGEEGQILGRWAGALSAAVGRRGSGEDAHHHVEGEEDLR